MKLTQVLVMASGLSLSVAGFAGNPPAQNNIPNQINLSTDKKSIGVDFAGSQKALKANGKPVSVNGKPVTVNGKPVNVNNVTIKTSRTLPALKPVKPK